MIRPCCTAVIGLLLSAIASAGTYYVDKNSPSASDSGPGSEAVPWLTLAHMIGAVSPGDHVYIKGGTSQTDPAALYQISNFHGMNVTIPGTAGNVITIEGYPGQVVDVNGTDEANHYGIRLYNASYYTFKNLVFSHFQVGTNDEWNAAKTNITIDHCEFRNCKWGASFSAVTNLTVTDTTIHDNFYNGVFFNNCDHVLVQRCQSYNNNDGWGPGGDSDGFSSNLVTYLLMVDCNSHDNGEDGFDMQAEGALINCVAQNMGSFGIKTFRRVNDSFANHPINLINCTITGNGSSGLLIANGNETHVYNCVIANNGENGIQVSSSMTNQSNIYSTVVNTIIYGNGTDSVYNPIAVYDDSGPATWMVVDCDHNVFYGNDKNTELFGVHSNTNALWTDPVFVNSTTDFHLQSTSPVIDAGIVIVGYHNSNPGDNAGNGKAWYGSAPDIGADEIALRAITGLSVSGTSQNSATIVWTAPGGQNYRKPTQYDIRYADSPITTEATWGTATQVSGEPIAGDFGQQQSFTITGLNPGASYYIAMKVGDDAGHFSQLSNVVPATTATSGNHAPVLTPIGDRSVVENATLTFSISATDADGDPLTYWIGTVLGGSSFNPATRTFTWTPTDLQGGWYRVMFQVSDTKVTVSETITITVRDTVNHAPVLGAIGDKTVNENASLSFSVSATDSDGDSLTFSATGLPSGATFANGVFSWTPSYEQAGSYRVTFTVSDGALTDSEQITITVVDVPQSSDSTAPAAHDFNPLADAFQIPLNSLIALTISDDGSGIDAGTVAISVNNQLVYTGGDSLYQSAYGVCRRTGTRASYRYYYQPAQPFGYDEHVSVYMTASDAAHNAMVPVFYQFATEMRSFGRNQAVSAGSDSSGHPAVAADSQGNLWAVWHAGQAGARDIYVAKRGSQGQQWDTPLRLTNLASDQCNPAIAISSDDTLHVVWQDNRRGNWDIYGCSSADGSTWGDPVRVTDSNDNQVNPVIAIDRASPYHVYIAWERGNAGNRDIYLASSSTSFASKTIARVTSDPTDQTEPALAVGSDNTVYLVWTDQRNGSADIYGSSSSASSWANIPIVTGPGNQSHPAMAVEPGASTLHVLWVDDAAGNLDVMHGTSNGLPGSPISGTNIVDDATGADQSAPAIATAKDHGNNTHVYACWQDNRSVGSAHDSDLYFVEIRSGAGGTNILVGDDGTNSNQSDPALGCDEYGQPAVLWVDSRGSTPRIYSACSTYFKPAVLASALIARSAGGRVGEDPASINDDGDVSIQIPANACDCDVAVNISEIENLPKFTALCIAGYEIGPSGVQFSFPATVTIPYTGSGSGQATPYWYDAQTGTLSQQGMTEITNRTLANGIPVVSFKTTHLTPFYILESPLPAGGVNGGGGCAMSSSQQGSSVAEFFLPYGALATFMLILKRRDRKYRGT